MSQTRLFLYGTLRDAELFKIVAGVPLAARPARLAGWRQVGCDGGRYPMLSSGGTAEGLVVEVDPATLTRLDFYETGFGYRRDAAMVETEAGPAEAQVYFCDPGEVAGDAPWRLDDWQARFADLSREAAVEYMRLFGREAPGLAASRYGQILSRAACRIAARRDPSPSDIGPRMEGGAVALEAMDEPHVGYFALRRDTLRFPTFGGGMSETVTRESLVAGDAVTVLPYDPEADTVLLLRQWRHGPFVRDDPNPWTLEPVAGRIDPGETPEETAHREMEEEAGIAPLRLEHMATYYPSPGPFSEHVISYLGLARLDGLDGQVSGLDSEAEDIMLHVVTFDALMEMVASGAANTGTLVLSALWLARERERLRRSGFS